VQGVDAYRTDGVEATDKADAGTNESERSVTNDSHGEAKTKDKVETANANK